MTGPASEQNVPAGDDADLAADHEGSKASRLFDLRWLIAAMFVVYGVVLIVVGILDGVPELKKASNVRINLWTGLGMLLIGLFFAAWARWKPLRHEDLVVTDDPGGPPAH
jgi:hypothetical protein